MALILLQEMSCEIISQVLTTLTIEVGTRLTLELKIPFCGGFSEVLG